MPKKKNQKPQKNQKNKKQGTVLVSILWAYEVGFPSMTSQNVAWYVLGNETSKNGAFPDMLVGLAFPWSWHLTNDVSNVEMHDCS